MKRFLLAALLVGCGPSLDQVARTTQSFGVQQRCAQGPFEVHVPASTTGTVYLASSATSWTHVPRQWVSPGIARLTITANRGDWIDYKNTRGSCDTVEKSGDCSERANRARLAGPRSQVDRVRNWRGDGC